MQSTEDTVEKPKVLIVEDDLLTQKCHEYWLKKIGCTVEIAKNGFEALVMYLKGYDLILLDCGLPKVEGFIDIIDGFEVCRRIRHHEVQHNITQVPIVMVSAELDTQSEVECKSVGINALAIKPVTTEQAMRDLLAPWLFNNKFNPLQSSIGF